MPGVQEIMIAQDGSRPVWPGACPVWFRCWSLTKLSAFSVRSPPLVRLWFLGQQAVGSMKGKYQLQPMRFDVNDVSVTF